MYAWISYDCVCAFSMYKHFLCGFPVNIFHKLMGLFKCSVQFRHKHVCVWLCVLVCAVFIIAYISKPFFLSAAVWCRKTLSGTWCPLNDFMNDCKCVSLNTSSPQCVWCPPVYVWEDAHACVCVCVCVCVWLSLCSVTVNRSQAINSFSVMWGWAKNKHADHTAS